MWTNVFKIGGLHHLSWFQFLPNESDFLIDKSVKEGHDAATFLVLSAHLLLQKEGFLSTWTNSFVGPWDPSQGLHNPDEKIKLWLFLPGRHSSVVETAQPAVSKLRVAASGFWMAPGDSEEVAAAISQALRNCIERALVALSYVRFGDVFSKHNQSQSEEFFRKGHPILEFIFAATEEAIFVHVIISAKHIRALSSADIERVLLGSSNDFSYRLPVIVSPHGIRGRLSGYCTSDLVRQVYLSSGKSKTSNGFVGLPHHVSQGSSFQLRGQNCYVEVTLGSTKSVSDKALQSGTTFSGKFEKRQVAETLMGEAANKKLPEHLSAYEKAFIYPAEALIVPVLQTSFARSSLKRFWLQNWVGPSLPGSSFFMNCAGGMDYMESDGMSAQHGYDSSSNSNSSSNNSLSSSSSDSDNKISTGANELEADADSMSCRLSGLSSSEQLENNVPKVGSKRLLMEMVDALNHVVTAANLPGQDAYKSNFGSLEVNDLSISGISNEPIGSLWDWDDDENGMDMDIQALHLEYGDFGDFFENDALPFGEPPGTTDLQALMFSTTPNYGDVGNSPLGIMDVSTDQILPVGFPSFDSFNPLPPVAAEESLSKSHEIINTALSSGTTNHTPVSSTGEFDQITKAEALMTFASEYGAVETSAGEFSSVFRTPYIPKSRMVEDSKLSPTNYIYGATPPSSPGGDGSNEKTGASLNSKASAGQSKNYYIYTNNVKEPRDRKSLAFNSNISACDGVASARLANLSTSKAISSVHGKTKNSIFEADPLLVSKKNVLATEVECLMIQASMCRLRHTLISSSNASALGLSRLTLNNVYSQMPNDPITVTDNISSKYDIKKKESIALRMAGEIDGGMLDGHVNATVGIWRSVGAPKISKPSNSSGLEVSPSLPQNSFHDEGVLSYRQRQPLQELLDGIPLLVQQATSFVDLALDAECGDGPYGWLALQEQWRRGFSCGPSMVHAGCGGTLASCHSLDIAGVELVDPLAANVYAPSVISLFQSDIKAALKSAFGILDGPLFVTDWCKGRTQSGDTGITGDGFSAESTMHDCKDSSTNVVTPVGEPVSPSQSSTSGPSCFKVSSATDGTKLDDSCQRRSNLETFSSESEQPHSSRLKPTVVVLPSPAILVGYQDDWLKTSASSLQIWEKAPLEPYALQKPMTYYVICPDIDPLTSAAADFFQQLGTVYEACKLGTHYPHNLGNQMDIDSGKWSSSGFVLLDCPQSMKIESNNASLVGSLSDYLLSLFNGWDLTSYLRSLSKALKALKLTPSLPTTPKEGSTGSCVVLYVVCPFPDPMAVLQTVIESSVAVGSASQLLDRDRRAILQSQVAKALSCSAAVDEALLSNVLVLPGFSLPKLVLQIVTVDVIFRVTSPSLNELIILKETAFTVYNKARRISRGFSNDLVQSSSLSSRSHSPMAPMPSSIQGMWKDCVGPRISGHSLPREGEIDSSLRTGNWDNSWQTRAGVLSYDQNRIGDSYVQEETRFMFEPLFILADPGSLEQGVSPAIVGNIAMESSRSSGDDGNAGFGQSVCIAGNIDTGTSAQIEGNELDGSCHPKIPSLHCCYGWTEDWRWLVCIWTDSRGELLDSHIFPFGGISSRQDTKGLECLFAQVLQQGCQILQSCASPETGFPKSRDFVISRIGNFFELEYLEWHKAIYSLWGSDVKKWPLQLRRCMPDGMPQSSNGASLQQQEMSLMQERALPSSPIPLYSPHSKSSGFIKGSGGQPTARKQLMGSHTVVDSSKSMLQWVQSISFVSISIDHTLQLVCQTDSPTSGGTQSGVSVGSSGYLEGFTPVKSLGSTSATYILIPSPSMRFLPPMPLHLPTCLTAESPPLAHLLHSKGSAIPLSTGFVVSKAVPSMRKDSKNNTKEEWPSILSIGLVDHYGGGNNTSQDKNVRGISKNGGRNSSNECRDFEIETHLVLEPIAAELHALSWMTTSPAYLDRRTALPFHCDMVLRLCRILHFADKEISRRAEKPQH